MARQSEEHEREMRESEERAARENEDEEDEAWGRAQTVATSDYVPAETRRETMTTANALVQVAESFLATKPAYRAGGARTQLIIHVDPAALRKEKGACRCELEDGTPIASETARRLACDASVVVMSEDSAGTPLAVGR